MNVHRARLFWGILLIGAGLVILARQLGYIDDSRPMLWAGIFAVISLAALLNYALGGWRQWWWLFPVGVFGGLALILALLSAGVDNAAVATPLFIGLALPFAGAYLLDRRRNWWALIPGGVMVFLALTTLIIDSVQGEWVGALFLFIIAGSFLVAYLSDRTRLWALIVAYAVAVLGIAPLMAMGGRDAAYFGPIFLGAVALPFLFVYFRSPLNWWAIIPAGALLSTAAVTVLALAGWIENAQEGGYAAALLIGGLAVTFVVVWLRDGKPWARTVSGVLAVMALFAAFFAAALWPVALILAGLYLLYVALRPKAA